MRPLSNCSGVICPFVPTFGDWPFDRVEPPLSAAVGPLALWAATPQHHLHKQWVSGTNNESHGKC
jgi:hypothetical protein